jgi:hypothetical protein
MRGVKRIDSGWKTGEYEPNPYKQTGRRAVSVAERQLRVRP